MNKLLLGMLILGSSTVYSFSALEKFSSSFNAAECVDESIVENTVISPEDFLDDSYDEAYNNAGENTLVTDGVKNVISYLESSIEGYCNNPRKALKALSNLIKNFDEIEGMMVEFYETGDDDSTQNFLIVMKDGTYTSIYFGN